MSEAVTGTTSRRAFLQGAGGAAAASALAGIPLPRARAGGINPTQVALAGWGGRGTGAAENALSVKAGPIKLVAMADVFPDRLTRSREQLADRFAKQVD